MRAFALVVASLLLAMTAAGCLGLGGNDGSRKSNGNGNGGDPTPTPTPTGNGGPDIPPPTNGPGARIPLLSLFTMSGCNGAHITMLAPLADLRALIPDNFTVRQADATPVPVDGYGEVEYLYVRCDLLATANVAINTSDLGSVAIRIEPPEEFPDQAAQDLHYYRLRMITQDDIMNSLWNASGYDVYRGNLSTAGQGPLGSTEPGMRGLAVGEYGWQGAVAESTPAQNVSTAYYTQTMAGWVVWTGDRELPGLPLRAHSMDTPSGDPSGASIDPLRSQTLPGRWIVDGTFATNDLVLTLT